MALWTREIDLSDRSRFSTRAVTHSRVVSARDVVAHRGTTPAPHAGSPESAQTRLRTVEPSPSAPPSLLVSDSTHAENRHPDWRDGRSFTWVTASGRALPVRIDAPVSGRVNGAVVIVPSLAREAVVSYRTIRSLAVRAARSGLLALTFSLSGDGDSEDLRSGDDAVQAWTDDIHAVAAQARELVGDELPVSFVGLRLGGALVQRITEQQAGVSGDCADNDNRGAYVVWEPVSGTSFLRHHVQLRATGVPGDPIDEGVELDGFHLDQGHADSLRTLPAARRSRANEHPEQQLSPGATHIRFEADRRDSVRLALGATYFAHVPLEQLDEIVAILPTGDTQPMQAWQPVTTATLHAVDDLGDTHEVSETLVDVGPLRLPGIVTTCAGVVPHRGLALSAMGAEVKWGPGRVFTRAARNLAPSGVATIRADRSLIGDDIDPDVAREPNPYTDASVADVCSAVTALRDTLRAQGVSSVGGAEGEPTLPVAMAGVCAGTWSQMRAAAEQPVDMLIAVNPVHWNPDASLYTVAFFDHYHGKSAPDLNNPPEPGPLGLSEFVRNPKRVIADAREVLMRDLAIRYPGLRSFMRPDVPVDKVRYLLDDIIGGTRIHFVLGTEEERIFNGKGGRRAIARASKRGVSVQIERLGNLDHSLLSEKARRDTLTLLRRLLTD